MPGWWNDDARMVNVTRQRSGRLAH